MHAFCKSLALVAGVFAFAASLRAQAGGSIAGTISTAAKALPPLRVAFDQNVCGKEMPDAAIDVDAQGHLANAVVTLTGVKARWAAAEAPVRNDKCRFAPRVQVARSHANVRTTSVDAILHTTNAATEKGQTLFNVALPVPGINITKPLGGAGVVRLTCNTHSWMRGFIFVTDDMAVVTGADGRFVLNDVPPGTYELRVWHESLKAAPRTVTVVAGKPTDISIQAK